MRPGRRHHRLRKLARPGPKAAPATEEIPLGIPVDPDDSALPEESTLIDAEPVGAPVPARTGKAPKPSKSATQDDTVQVLALKGKPVDPNEETEGALDGDLEPDPPDKIGFTCTCGVRLVATRKAYDKRMRCAKCQTLMLISLVWNPAAKKFEIEPFRVDVPDLPT
jgi:hypothetical protein